MSWLFGRGDPDWGRPPDPRTATLGYDTIPGNAEFIDLEALTPPPGGEALRWIGWVPLARALEGARPRIWEEDAATAAIRMQAESFGAP